MTMSSLTATIGGYTYDLTDRQRYLWMQDDSLGMAPLHRILERGPNQHGETDLGFRLDPRIVNLVIGLFGTDDSDYWNARKELLKIFTPSTTPITLTFTLPNGQFWTGPRSSLTGRVAANVLVVQKQSTITCINP